MRANLTALLDEFRRMDREIAVVRYRGVRRTTATYGELARVASRFGAWLAASGIGPGDRVVLWAENGAEWIAAFYGCMLRGALVVPLDAYGTAEFAARICRDVSPRMVVGDAALLAGLDGEWPKLAFEDWPGRLPEEEAGPVDGLSAETPLQILFTSGTTGDPKGIVHTHGNVLASVEPIERAAAKYLRYERLVHPLRFLHTLPLSHVFGQMMGLWMPPLFAAEVHFESRLVAPRLVETIRRERISVLAAVPRVMALLKMRLEATYPDLADRLAGAAGWPAWKRWWRFREVHRALGLKFWALIVGGGALPGTLEEFWNGLGFVVVQGYGMTETTALITLNHPFHVARGTIGKPLTGREVRLGADGEVLVRGPMISPATWSGGALRARGDEWLATGDLAVREATGELRFVGRKSEVIVTAAGVNLHPEDLEAAIEQEPGVRACAVVGQETAQGPEPCAVLAFRGERAEAALAMERATRRLAEFQRVSRWVLWPEPDLPRTSTGKVRRKAVAEWLAAHGGDQGARVRPAGTGGAQDWLATLVAQTTGETRAGGEDRLRLIEDLHLDSLGRVQLAAAIEERLGEGPAGGLLDAVKTLGELRRLVGGTPGEEAADREAGAPVGEARKVGEDSAEAGDGREAARPGWREAGVNYIYPHWPWSWPMRWVRAVFVETVMRPLVWLLADPRVSAGGWIDGDEPLLIIANHVTSYDGPLLEYALPGRVRRRMAVAMSGEMVEDYRHFRNPEPGARYGRLLLAGPAVYLLLTGLFNVFPLPRMRGFQRSFSHAGAALDRGFHVLVFPEGTRSATGELAGFRPGIGLLVKQAGAAVLPMAIRGLGELKSRRRGWVRAGTIEVRVGSPVRFGPEETEAAITARLHAEVEGLLSGSESTPGGGE